MKTLKSIDRPDSLVDIGLAILCFNLSPESLVCSFFSGFFFSGFSILIGIFFAIGLGRRTGFVYISKRYVKGIRTDDNGQLKRGDRIRLTWQPGRLCDVEYLGDAMFRILSVEATKLKPGQTFTCHIIVAGEPLFLENLSSANPDSLPSTGTSTYVCGSRHGIHFLPL